MQPSKKIIRWFLFSFWAAAIFAILLSGCAAKNSELSEKLLGIELEESLGELRSRGLTNAEEQKLKGLEKEMRALAKKIQEPLLNRARYANRNQAVALIFMRHGMYEVARKYLEQAIEIEGDNTALFYYRGLCSGLLMKNSIDIEEREAYLQQAKWDYQRSLEIKPDYIDSLYGLAVLELFESEDFGAAAGLLDRYLAKRNISKKAAQSVGRASTLRQAQRQAKELSLRANSKDINALFMRARAAYGLGRLNEAASFYDWAGTAAISEEARQRAEELKNQVLQANNYRTDLP